MSDGEAKATRRQFTIRGLLVVTGWIAIGLAIAVQFPGLSRIFIVVTMIAIPITGLAFLFAQLARFTDERRRRSGL